MTPDSSNGNLREDIAGAICDATGLRGAVWAVVSDVADEYALADAVMPVVEAETAQLRAAPAAHPATVDDTALRDAIKTALALAAVNGRLPSTREPLPFASLASVAAAAVQPVLDAKDAEMLRLRSEAETARIELATALQAATSLPLHEYVAEVRAVMTELATLRAQQAVVPADGVGQIAARVHDVLCDCHGNGTGLMIRFSDLNKIRAGIKPLIEGWRPAMEPVEATEAHPSALHEAGGDPGPFTPRRDVQLDPGEVSEGATPVEQPEPRVWRVDRADNPPTPGEDEIGLRVRDRYDRVWLHERWTTSWGWWCSANAEIPADGSLPGGMRFNSLISNYGPLTEVPTEGGSR